MFLGKYFKHIWFYPTNHTYYNSRIKEFLESTTTYLSRTVFPKFEADKVSEIVASKNGVTKEEVLMQWRKKADLGTRVHEGFEQLFNRKRIDFSSSFSDIEDYEKVMMEVVRWFYQEGYTALHTEFVIGSNRLGGMIDLLACNKDGIHIFDFKTDREIRFHNPYSSCYEPFQYLEDTNYNKYRFQLSIYKRIFESVTGLEVLGLKIIHVLPDDFKIYELEDVYNSERDRKIADEALDLGLR